MNNFLILFISVYIGSGLAWLLKKNPNINKLILTFSGSYLLSITLLHLLPEIFYISSKNQQIAYYLLGGVFFQILLDYLTKGAEHGHIHLNNNKRFPYAVFIGLLIHAFVEGIPINKHTHNQLLFAIIIHKIPVALIFFYFVRQITNNIFIQFILIFALSAPLGSFIGDNWLQNYIPEALAIVSGIFLHISTLILFENAESHTYNIQKVIAIVFGLFLALWSIH